MVKKLVLPLAGRGKRLLPLTLNTPKNLVEVAGRPLIEYTLVEAVRSGIEDVILIVSPDHMVQFEEFILEAVKRYPQLSFHVEIQERPFGHGHAILQVADRIEGEPFAVRFPDDIILNGSIPTLKKMIDFYTEFKATTVLLEKVPMEEVSRYGVVDVKPFDNVNRIYGLSKIVEKPKVADAPSNLIICGAYVVSPSVLENIKELFEAMPEKDDALLLGDGISKAMEKGEQVLGWDFGGIRLDCGTLENLERTNEFFRLNSGPYRSSERVAKLDSWD